MTLEDIYLENYPIVYGYLLSLCGDPWLAEDLTAETFLKAIQSIRRYDKTCKPSTWLCTIGRNLYFNHRKRKKRHVSLDDGVHATTDSLEEKYLERDLARRLYRLAKQLEPVYQQVFFLRLEGMSFREIGAAMERSENWARVTYFRAKAKILQGTEEDNG